MRKWAAILEDATNFPLVRLVNAATGHVVYCRTHNHSRRAVATGNKRVSTQFDVLPANAERASANCLQLRMEFLRLRSGSRCSRNEGAIAKLGRLCAMPWLTL